MSKLTTEQYLLLSKVAYSDFSKVDVDNPKVSTLTHLSTLKTTNFNLSKLRNETTSVLSDYKNYTTNAESAIYKTGAFQSLQSWWLVDFEQKTLQLLT